ncbi:AraC family transcriptional regulator [Paenibacillus sp. YYML68]|uniref:AraC family transcriptional regulator n=1 Tax=Paenibacillus sp. YYML68 TaxID=2909250 RepID=UPI00249223DF|nr:AraC family transcriptional regulator [Paenibacillus sp. YYML68]
MQWRFGLKIISSNKQIRLIAVITVLLSTLISSVSMLLYYDYRGKLDKELHQPNAELLQINLHVTNRAFRSYDSEAVQLSFHPTAVEYVSAAAERKQETAAGLLAHLKELSLEEEIHSVYVVDTKQQRIVSSKGEQELPFAQLEDLTWIHWIQEMEKKPLLIQRRSFGSGFESGQLRSELISLYRPIRVNDEQIGLVIMNIDYDRLFTTIHKQLKAPQYIFNLDGELIYPKTNLPIEESDMRKVLEAIDIHPFHEVKLDKQTYLANQAFSDVTGWRWVSLISLDDLLRHVRLVRDIIVLLSLLSIVVGCIAIYFYSYASFRPVKRIRQLIGHDEQARANGDGDLYDIEQYIQRLLKEFDSKAAISKQSLPEIRSKLVQDVLYRRIGAKELQYKWQRYFQEWSSSEPVTAVIVSINRYKVWSAEFNEEDQLLLKYALTNLIEELAAPQWHLIDVKLDVENMLLIVQPKSSADECAETFDAEASIQELFNKAITASRAYLHTYLSVGIGMPVRSIHELEQSYAAARAALAYRLYEGYGRVLSVPLDTPASAADSPKSGIDTEKLQREWLGLVESGSWEQLEGRIRSWSEMVAVRRAEPAAVYGYADQWIGTLSQLCHTYELHQPHALEDYTAHQLHMMDLADVASLLLQLSEAVTEGFRSRMTRKEHTLVQRMIQFMQEQLKENIGLQQIADSVQMSTSSVSSIFKQETGHSVYEYLTSLRIKEACRLLTDTDRKVADIAALVGYQNETSFIRSFRKVKGMTPGKYREISRAHE